VARIGVATHPHTPRAGWRPRRLSFGPEGPTSRLVPSAMRDVVGDSNETNQYRFRWPARDSGRFVEIEDERDAEGVRDIPRLGGLSYAYLKRRLEQRGQGYHAAAPPPMPRIASKLPPDQIEALAFIPQLRQMTPRTGPTTANPPSKTCYGAGAPR
jgi:hypothetical protein